MKKPQAIVVRESQLTEHQRAIINVQTPPEFIKERAIRGGKRMARYVEGGYIIAKLNQAFGPASWDFDVVEQSIVQEKPKGSGEKVRGEVWVKGKLTIKDHKAGYSVSKTQFGTKEMYEGVPLGDTLKAAATDAMKKCAVQFGIALDVYWGQMDEEKPEVVKNNATTEGKVSSKALFDQAKKRVEGMTDVAEVIALDESVQASKLPADFKKKFKELANKRVDALQK